MEQNFNRRVPTDLDLNGPLLAISSHPSDVTASNGDTKTFSVSASATFPGNADPSNSGTLTFQWFLDDGTDDIELKNESIGVTYSGVTTDTLTLTGIQSPSQNGDKYFCRINYIAADKYDESEKGTGIPITGSINSNKATLTVNPFIQILSQPSSVDREFNVNGELTVTAQISDDDYSDDIGYQWHRNGNPISDGRQTSTRIERGTVTEIITETNEVVTRHNYSFNRSYFHSSAAQTHVIPATASNVKIKIAGAGGGRGANDANGTGGNGGNGAYGEFNLSSAAGTTLTIYAGKKGSDGTNGGSAPGGTGGGFPNYASGGRGGNSGPHGTSGSGGGGGGASAVEQGGTLIIVAGGGGGGGGASYPGLHGVDAGSPVTITYSSGYPKQQFGVHNNGKLIKYGDEGGGDANGELYITSGSAVFTSFTQIVGSGSVRLQYNWSDMPNYSGRANDRIFIGNLATLEHPPTRRGSNSATFTLPGNADAKNAGGWDSKSGTIYADGAHAGFPCFCTDGGGGGGGGAGYVSSPGAGAGTGGAGGCDNGAAPGGAGTGGTSGNGGESAYRGTFASLTTSSSNSGQGYVNVSYDWYEDETTTVVTFREVEKEIENSIPQNIDFSGTRGKTLTVKADYETVENLHCVVSSPTATNSPVTSDTAQFSSFSNLADKRLYLEQVFWDNGTATALLSTIDLNNGPVELTVDDGSSGSGLNIFTCFYTNEDMYLTVEMQGGRGLDYVQPAGIALPPGSGGEGAFKGGRGGYGRIQIMTKANREFTIAGLFNGINTPYLYYTNQLIAVVGEGGQAGALGAGGDGGGMSQGGYGYHGLGGYGGRGGSDGSSDNGNWGTADGGGGAPAAVQSFGAQPNRPPCYGFPRNCNYLSNVGYVGSHAAQFGGFNNLACDSNQNRFCDGISDTPNGGRVKINSKNNINGRDNSGFMVGAGAKRKIKMRDGTILQNTATLGRRGFADIEGSFIFTAGKRKPDGLGGRGGNGAIGGEGSGNGRGGGGGSGFIADIAYDPNIGVKEFDGVKFFVKADSGKIDDGGAKVKISLDTTKMGTE